MVFEMVQWVKGLATKPDNLNLSPEPTQCKLISESCPLTSALPSACPCAHIQTHRLNKIK